MKKLKKIIIITISIILLISLSTFFYLNDYYHAVDVESYLQSNEEIIIEKETYGISFTSKGNDKALIFYPGAKVEYTAYSELMYQLSLSGLDCYLIKMPANLAFLGINKADNVISNTKYQEYYLAGHSLGGVAAANYVYNNQNKVNGLILLASYSTKKLSNTNLKILSIYGTNDLILNKESYNKNCSNLGKYQELVIEGGNHLSFASYGHQKKMDY